MPNSRGSWPSLPQSTLKSFSLWTKGPPGVKLCCHTKVPSHSGQDTRPYPDVSSWPLRPSNLPTAAHRELCDWAMHNCSYPGGPTSLPCPLLYSAFLTSSCTPFSREQVSPALTHLCLFPFFPLGATA